MFRSELKPSAVRGRLGGGWEAEIVFLDTEVFKGPRFAYSKTLDVQTHYKPTETFQYTHFSSSHPLSVKKGFIKGETLRLLRTNSVTEIFELRKLEFLTRLLERGYPRELAENISAEVKFSSQNEALQNKTKTSRNVLPFITTFNPAMPNLKKVLMKHWHLITETNRLGQIYSEPPELSPTGRTSLLKTFWSELKFLRIFNNSILEL